MVDGDTSYPFLQHAAKEDIRTSRPSFVLNTTINNILHILKDKPFLRCPKLLPEHLARKNPRDHATRSCRVLRDHIEELLDQGHCWEFVRDKARKEGLVEPNERD
ncbi:hypothetical protein DVH24_037946 [Malus domestica]|uniref:Uncharacterized protein n=1 Tax=Malus domestica TaxID=3750 RepID=A0A498JZF8_MALDO|nr:hypothetical protein DVH24_037946 [Malus domestica]